jgi:hypothetical protein
MDISDFLRTNFVEFSTVKKKKNSEKIDQEAQGLGFSYCLACNILCQW